MLTRHGDPYFNLLDDLRGVDIVWALTPDDQLREIATADAVYGWPSQAQLRAAKQLKWIQTPSAGVEMLCALPEMLQSEIQLTNGRGAHARVIAEHAFGMLLALTRRLVPYTHDKTMRRWDREGFIDDVLEICGWTMGIVGYGNIGQQTAKRALAFEMDVLATDIEEIANPPHGVDVWPIRRLDELMERSDVVVIAAPFTPRTKLMIGRAQIQRMKRGSFLIVVSRGGIVDEAAVAEALLSGHLAGAGMDVFEQEPYPLDGPLWNIPNLIMTPHLAGASTQKDRRCVEILRENVGRFQRGETLINLCDVEKGY
jgi:phosphoglycerate dehydrogenase-like enzyme